jgi:hypothetical protein
VNRKIIIRSDDFDREIFFFLNEVGADIPVEWNREALDQLKNVVVDVFAEMGVTLEIDNRYQHIPPPLSKRGDIGMHHSKLTVSKFQ